MEILLTLTNPEDIHALNEFLQYRPRIQQIVQRSLELSPPVTASSATQTLRKVTKAFKQFCGGEWVNKNGCMTFDAAKQRIQLHILTRNLTAPNGQIYMDDELREAVNAPFVTFFEYDLQRITEGAFEAA